MSSSEFQQSIDDLQYIFPYKFGIEKDLKNNTNNYFNASIHCLLNIKQLTLYLISSLNKNEDKYIYFIADLIKELNNQNRDNKIIKEIFEKLKNYIKEKNYQYNSDNDPRKLIEFIFKNLQKISELPEEIKTRKYKKCNSCGNISETNTTLNIIKFDIPEIIKNKKNINQKNNNIIQKDKITIYDCFDYYFKSLNNNEIFFCDNCQNTKIDLLIKELPSILIIFIDYGTDKNYEISYEFDEEINFKNYNYDNNNRDYFLSSIIACKNLGTYFELFYTFVRENEFSKYILYNGMEVRNNLGVKNKLIKNKNNLKDKKQSWPFVLIYIDKNLDNIEAQ